MNNKYKIIVSPEQVAFVDADYVRVVDGTYEFVIDDKTAWGNVVARFTVANVVGYMQTIEREEAK